MKSATSEFSDGDVNFVDYAVFANYWTYQNCTEPNLMAMALFIRFPNPPRYCYSAPAQ